jgi:DnaJ-class molecular chaperone
MKTLVRTSITGTLLACALGTSLLLPVARAQDKAAATNKYIGVEKCKNCHQSEASGNQYGHWQQAGHSKAFEALASDAAKAAGKERGVEDPQKSEKCLKCHVTAFGVPAEGIKKGFRVENGVQCESCHGPGEQHMKARFASAASASAGGNAARVELPAGEIVAKVEMKACLVCHNEESPTFKPFCFKERWAKIGHFDPRKPRPADYQVDCNCPKCAAEKK